MSDGENERLATLEERLKSNSDRIDRFEKLAGEIHAQNENIAKLVVRLEYTDTRIRACDRRLSEIEAQPKIRLNAIIGAILAALSSAILGGVVSMLLR